MVEENENKELEWWDRCLNQLHSLMLYEFLGGTVQTWDLCQVQWSWRILQRAGGKWGGSGEGHWGKKKKNRTQNEAGKRQGVTQGFLKKVWSFDFKNLEQSGTAGIKTKWEGVVVG